MRNQLFSSQKNCSYLFDIQKHNRLILKAQHFNDCWNWNFIFLILVKSKEETIQLYWFFFLKILHCQFWKHTPLPPKKNIKFKICKKACKHENVLFMWIFSMPTLGISEIQRNFLSPLHMSLVLLCACYDTPW